MTRPPRSVIVALVLAAGGLVPLSAMGQTSATWVNPVSGNWTDPTLWSTNPVFPNNGGTTYNVFIDQTGSPYDVSLDQDITITDLHLTSADAILDLNAHNLNVNGNYTQSGAELRAPVVTGTLTVAGTATFSGSFTSDALNGVSTFAAQNTLIFNPITTIDICDTDIFHDGSSSLWGSGNINLKDGATYHEGANGTFNISSNGTFAFGNGAAVTFFNAGTIRKSGGGGLTSFTGVSLDNTGTVQVESGTLRSDTNVQVSGSTLTGGKWKVLGGSTLDLAGAAITTNQADVTLDGSGSTFPAINGFNTNGVNGKFTVQNGGNFQTNALGNTFNNNGQITVGTGSIFTVNPADSFTNYNPGTHRLVGGTLSVSGLFKFPNAGVTTLASDVTLSGAGSDLQDNSGTSALTSLSTIDTTGALTIQNGRNFQTGGTFTVAESGSFHGSLTVGAGTLFRVAPGSTFTNFTSGQINLGGFTLAGTLQFDNAAINTVNSQINLDGGGTHIIDQFGHDAFTNLATVQPAGNLSVRFGQNMTINNSLSLQGRLGIGPSSGLDTPSVVTVNNNFTQDPGGILDLDGGILNVLGTAAFNGSITGAGTINGNPVLSGILNPGHSTGLITVGGNFSFAGGSSFLVDLGGTAASDYDQASVLGTAAFGPGTTTLTVSLINGFHPAAGQTFDVLLFNGRSGSFTTYSLPGLDPGLGWEIRYLPGALELAVVPGPGGLAVGLAGLVLAARRRRR